MQYKDYYSIMELKRDASAEDIKRAYRKLARKYHPDVSKEPNAEAKFKELGEAYEVLKDPKKRAEYDQLGSQWQQGQEFRPPPGWQQQTGDNFNFTGGDEGDFSDFFASLFGRQAGGGWQQQRRRPPQRKGDDLRSKILINLEDAYQGTTRAIQLAVPEMTPDGTVQTKQRTLNVKIPAGITQGKQIRLTGQGHPGMGQAPNGDLYLEIEFQDHPLFKAEGSDIYLTLPITPWEAALGATLQVPTLGGKVDVKIPPGSQSNQKLRLKGRGLPTHPPGDQYIVLQAMIPKAENQAAKDLYQQMAEKMAFNPREKMGV